MLDCFRSADHFSGYLASFLSNMTWLLLALIKVLVLDSADMVSYIPGLHSADLDAMKIIYYAGF